MLWMFLPNVTVAVVVTGLTPKTCDTLAPAEKDCDAPSLTAKTSDSLSMSPA